MLLLQTIQNLSGVTDTFVLMQGLTFGRPHTSSAPRGELGVSLVPFILNGSLPFLHFLFHGGTT